MSVFDLRSYYCGMSECEMSMSVMSVTESAALWRPEIVLLWDECARDERVWHECVSLWSLVTENLWDKYVSLVILDCTRLLD
jgi:hypothetical protein